MNSIDFKIEQNTESTWSFILENNENQIKIWASEFMDPIGSLFYELRLLLKKGQNKGLVSLIDEPQENIIVLDRINDNVRIKVLNFNDYSGSSRNLAKGKTIFNGEIKLNRFLNQVINSLQPY